MSSLASVSLTVLRAPLLRLLSRIDTSFNSSVHPSDLVLLKKVGSTKLKVKRGFRVKIHDFGSRLCQLFDWQLGSDDIFILPYYLDNDIHTLTYQASESNMANNSHREGAKITIFFSKSTR